MRRANVWLATKKRLVASAHRPYPGGGQSACGAIVPLASSACAACNASNSGFPARSGVLPIRAGPSATRPHFAVAGSRSWLAAGLPRPGVRQWQYAYQRLILKLGAEFKKCLAMDCSSLNIFCHWERADHGWAACDGSGGGDMQAGRNSGGHPPKPTRLDAASGRAAIFPAQMLQMCRMPVGSPVTRCINSGGRYREPSWCTFCRSHPNSVWYCPRPNSSFNDGCSCRAFCINCAALRLPSVYVGK